MGDRATIRRLVGDLPVRPLKPGLDHRVYAVGEDLVARFGDDVEREAALLAAIAPRLPLPVPVPVAVEPGCMVQPRVPGTPLLALKQHRPPRHACRSTAIWAPSTCSPAAAGSPA